MDGCVVGFLFDLEQVLLQTFEQLICFREKDIGFGRRQIVVCHGGVLPLRLQLGQLILFTAVQKCLHVQ